MRTALLISTSSLSLKPAAWSVSAADVAGQVWRVRFPMLVRILWQLGNGRVHLWWLCTRLWVAELTVSCLYLRFRNEGWELWEAAHCTQSAASWVPATEMQFLSPLRVIFENVWVDKEKEKSVMHLRFGRFFFFFLKNLQKRCYHKPERVLKLYVKQ